MATHPTRKAHVIGFDYKMAVKKSLNIVTACTVVKVNQSLVLLHINEAVCNPTSEHSLLSKYQFRDFGAIINSVARKHVG